MPGPVHLVARDAADELDRPHLRCLLAFALSFDEVIVTTFTAGAQNTLPLWIFGNIRLGESLPETNVVVLVMLAAMILPVALAQRLTRESGILRAE